MEAAPPRGRPEFDPDHIAVHHFRLNQNAEKHQITGSDVITDQI
jgi:hypothetical protein